MEKVYIETTIPSYLTSKASDDVIAAARQQITKEWWEIESPSYDLYVSEVVRVECSKGNFDAAKKRIAVLEGIPNLELNDEIALLAQEIFEKLSIPDKARDDALHIAIACFHDVDYLLSWNFKHIVNASMIRKLRDLINQTEYTMPQICTPEELIQ
jgi:predicted nucleic acid-binding protein